MGDNFFQDAKHSPPSISQKEKWALKPVNDRLFPEYIDMDMSYTRVLHIKVAYRTSQMTSRLLGNTAAAMLAHNVLCNSYNTRPLICARITCYVTVITVEINHCSFRRVRFALLYIVTRSKIV
jgi:hypothetical protein